MTAARSQRWRDRRTMYVPDCSVIDPREFGVEIIHCHRDAKPFVETHHFSQSLPATRLSVGLFRKTGVAPSRLVGVAAFSVGMNPASTMAHLGLPQDQAVELGRLVLLDEIAANGESWFGRRAFSALRRARPSVIGVLSYCDPVERRGPDGAIIKPGHVGQVYRALSATPLGRARPRTHLITPDGHPFSERAASKIRSGEVGQAYAIDELVGRGAPRPTGDPRQWYDELVRTGWLRKLRHPGNYVFGFSLTQRAKAAARRSKTFTALQAANAV
jgi:hypothetical protein